MNAFLSVVFRAALAWRAEPMLEASALVEPEPPATAAVELASPAPPPLPAQLVEAAPPSAAEGDSPAALDPIPVHVALELVSIPEADAPYLERSVLSELTRLLAAEGFVAAAEAERSVLVRIRLVDEGNADYWIDIELWSHGRRLEPTLGHITCSLCPDIMVIEAIVEHMPAALDALGRASTVAPAERERMEPAELVLDRVLTGQPEPVARSSRPTGHHKARQLGPVGILGTVLGLGGLGVMSYGCWAVAKGRRHEIDPSNDERLVFHDHTRGGWTLYGVGLGSTAVGIVAIAADVSALHERRARRLAVDPVFDSTHAGLRLRGRF